MNERCHLSNHHPPIRSRLNATAGVSAHLDDPLMKSALARLFTSIEPAVAKLETFSAQIPP